MRTKRAFLASLLALVAANGGCNLVFGIKAGEKIDETPDASTPDGGTPDAGCTLGSSTDSANCGTCGHVCGDANAFARCHESACQIMCMPGFKHCSTNDADGCEIDIARDPKNCGDCNQACGTSNTSAVACDGSTCTPTCKPGFKHCSTKYADGCEVNTTNDPKNCGACGHVCGDGNTTAVACVDSKCVPTCKPGFKHCSTADTDGCETDITKDGQNCGGCGIVCGNANSGGSGCSAATCIFMCNDGFKHCSQDVATGCETNTTLDPDNCGGCGQSCGVETCVDSACKPTVLASGVGTPGSLVIDSKNVYFTTLSKDVDSVPIVRPDPHNPPPVTVLVHGALNPSYITVDDKNVYFGNYTLTGSITSVPIAGGSATDLATNVVSPNVVVVRNGVLYFAAEGAGGKANPDGIVGMIPTEGGSVAQLAMHEVGPEVLVLDSMYAYFTNYDFGGNTIKRVPIAGGLDPTTIVTTAGSPFGIAVDGNTVYYSDIVAGGIYSTASDGTGTPTQLTQPGATSQPMWILLDDKLIYWVDRGNNTLACVPRGGGPATTLLTGLVTVGTFALDDTSIFVADRGNDRVLRINKP